MYHADDREVLRTLRRWCVQLSFASRSISIQHVGLVDCLLTFMTFPLLYNKDIVITFLASHLFLSFWPLIVDDR